MKLKIIRELLDCDWCGNSKYYNMFKARYILIERDNIISVRPYKCDKCDAGNRGNELCKIIGDGIWIKVTPKLETAIMIMFAGQKKIKSKEILEFLKSWRENEYE